MNRPDVEEAIAEAKRFIAKAELLLAIDMPTYDHKTRTYGKQPWNGYNGASPQASATRRASLDLTRSLARMRRR